MAVYRVYVEKKSPFDVEAQGVLSELRSLLGIEGLTGLRLLNRYDVEGLDEALMRRCLPVVFSEPQVDIVYTELPEADEVFAVEYLPGQFDQRADSCAECVQLLSQAERPAVRTAKVYLLSGSVTPEELAKIKHYLINPVESREASLDTRVTLAENYPEPDDVAVLEGFTALDRAGLEELIARMGLAMDADDAEFCREYFKSEGREPTVTELRVLDTYWSDHCRHTTFGTILDGAEIADARVRAAYEHCLAMRRELGRENKPLTLMELATLGARYLKKTGKLKGLDESEEINACSVRITADVDGHEEPWLLMFKNETHNHPTEIEPFGGAATCIGGAIRDPLSGRAYVYQAMRVTGAGDPLVPVSETLPGKLPQRKLVTTAAAGYSSYGNQIGLATGLVDELYHPGYVAKRMEIGAVVAAAPEANVIREEPVPGDLVILLGGRTGRDGCGGATGSSKAHGLHSLETCGAEVQKGNAPVERKLQRLFRNGEATRLIRRCNDFGAGGVSVAIGELADGLDIDLDTRPAQVRRPRRHGACHLREPGAHGRRRLRRGRGALPRPRGGGEPGGHGRGVRHRRAEAPYALARQDDRRPQPRVPRLQRRGEARARERACHLGGGPQPRRVRDAGGKALGADERPRHLLEARPRRQVRQHDRRGHGGNALRRRAAADAHAKHDSQAPRHGRDQDLLGHGLRL